MMMTGKSWYFVAQGDLPFQMAQDRGRDRARGAILGDSKE